MPVFWKGLKQQEISDLYLAGQSVYDPELGRFITQAATGDSNPYRFEGNRPTSPDPAFTTSSAADSPSLLRSVIGDETLANANDYQFYGALGIVTVGTGLTAGFGLAVLGAPTTVGTLFYANLAFGTAGLTVSGTRFTLTGEGGDDVVSDIASLRASAVIPNASGSTKAAFILADLAANLYQADKSARFATDAFRQGDIAGAVLNTLGFAGAAGRAVEFNKFGSSD